VAAASFFLLVVLLLQWFSFAYTREFGGDADEPAHYITGLMFHDYCAAGLPSGPMRFAESYYLHYPKVALGHWPPFFYVVQTLWTLPFGTSRISLMLLMAALTASLAVLVERAIAADHGLACSLIATGMLLCLPAIHYGESRVMSESLEALLCFAALRCWGRSLQGSSRWGLLGFVCFAILAILTKGTGLSLAIVPGFSLLLLRRFRVFGKPSFWVCGLAVAVICLPAYTLLPNTGLPALRRAEGIHLNLEAVGTLPRQIIAETGPLAAALIGIGIAAWLWSALRGKATDEHLTTAGAAVFGFLILRAFVVAAEEGRHLAIVAAPLMLFLASGAAAVARQCRRSRLRFEVGTGWVVLAAAAVFLATSFARQPKPEWGLSPVLSELLANRVAYGDVFLISSDSTGEGVVIAETAMRERRPGHYILRASQALAEQSWSGFEYRSKLTGALEIGKYLDSVPVSTVILIFPPGMVLRPYHSLLQQFLRTHPEVWYEQVFRPDPARSDDALTLVYRRAIVVDTSHPRIELDLAGNKLGRSLHN